MSSPMTQGELGNGVDILLFYNNTATPCRMGTGRSQPHQIGAHAVDAGSKTTLGDGLQGLIVQGDAIQQLARLLTALA